MMIDTSEDPADKLQAALNHDWADPRDELGVAYRNACKVWFASLSERERSIALKVRESFERYDEKAAEKIAAELPPAPKFP